MLEHGELNLKRILLPTLKEPSMKQKGRFGCPVRSTVRKVNGLSLVEVLGPSVTDLVGSHTHRHWLLI